MTKGRNVQLPLLGCLGKSLPLLFILDLMLVAETADDMIVLCFYEYLLGGGGRELCDDVTAGSC